MASLDIPSASTAQLDALKELKSSFTLTTDRLHRIVEGFVHSMNEGLEKDGKNLAMIPSYVKTRPTGDEKGTYLALDLGGTNLRVCEVSLKGDSQFDIVQQKFTIPQAIKHSNARTFFDWIADCVSVFLTDHDKEPSPTGLDIPLGFTFSFAVAQSSINRGTLIMWNKGFTVEGVVGRDVVLLLQDALKRKHLRVSVAALVNDTVGALMTSAYQHPSSLMGVIFGTGTNAAYFEKAGRIPKWIQSADGARDAADVDEMVINMEWGGFDNDKDVLPLTFFDNGVDRETQNPGKQIFEKMISGLYLGEVTRKVLLHLVDRRLLFNGRSSTELNQPYSFDTAYMSTIVADETPDLADTQYTLESVLLLPPTTPADRAMVKAVCYMLGLRAARLSAAALASVLTVRKDVLSASKTTIGIDGSMYEFYPSFERFLMEAMAEILGEKLAQNIHTTLSKDGSGVGAAIVAMVADKQREMFGHN
ncbi:hypothetical protein H4R33_003247 [Dimargaris cristalligena]|uniref:Phosphotransferase n=1 Tax=Dimargaris cristalligena TaxID=215637 RepID=A0A4Q0A2T9_9FUNG|nr:hypothetical protein H4R33_003247 [Dimargaris cristalligena]RKP39510.1 hexokinase-domain-containing protein [Dimargaris cristalligena]|eukprot:RKP39510.1 hexokinase-domain-containing protein [Dimargaris cristalligena]